MSSRRGTTGRGGLLLAAGLLCVLGLTGCDTQANRFRNAWCERVDGKLYLIVETAGVLDPVQSTFAAYQTTEPALAAWQPAFAPRVGPIYGTCAYRKSDGERLCLLLSGRISFTRFREDGPQDETVLPPFDWQPETGAQVGETLFVFGGENEGRRLRAARFENGNFVELKLENPPPLTARAGEPFWLKSVAHAGTIHVFWRPMASVSEGLDMDTPLEGIGTLVETVFEVKGQELKQAGAERVWRGFPEGWADVWSDGTHLNAVVQTQDPSYRSPPLRLFTLPPEGDAVEAQIPAPPGTGPGFKYYLPLRLPAANEEAFLRTNSQTFELWERTPDGWRITERPSGLPQNHLEHVLLMLLALCVGIVATGLGLAYRRRRMLRWTTGKLEVRDVLAPLGLRVSAFLVDLCLMVVALEGLTRLAQLAPIHWSRVLADLPLEPAYVAVYLLYMTLTECVAGRTLGKYLLGLRVVTQNGERPPFRAALIRNVLGLFERQLVLAPLGALPLMLLTPLRQRLGDLLGRTIVVQSRALKLYQAQRRTMQLEEHALFLVAPRREEKKDDEEGERK